VNLYSPFDLPLMLKKYSGEGNGPCGLACIAVIEHRNISEVLKDWQPLFGEYRGYALWKELRQYLQNKGWKVKLRKVTNGEIDPTADKFVIFRVQWVGPNPDKPDFACWNHWTEAAAHTHFILVQDHDVFCSEDGWFCLSKLNDYLDGKGIQTSGLITSYMEVSR